MTRVVQSLNGVLIDTHTVGTVQPTGPLPGDLWLDTGATPLDLATQAELDTAIANFRRPIERLNYTPVADLLNNVAVTVAAGWTDVCSAQSFTSASPSGSWLEVTARVGGLAVGSGAVTQFALRLIFDSGQTYNLFSGACNASPAQYSGFNGGYILIPNPLAAGTRTARVQIFARSQTINVYCRPIGEPNTDWFNLRVVEWVP